MPNLMRHLFNRCCSTAILFLLFALPFAAVAQCPNDNSLTSGFPSNLTPPTVGSTVTNTQIWGGEYATVNVQSGASYTISTCVGNSYNTILSLYNEGAGTLAAFNDNFCGLQSQVTYVATFTGVLRVLVDEQPGCAANGTNTTVSVTLNSLPCSAPGIASDPANATVCPGGSATFSATTSASPDSVRWFRSTDGGSTWLRIANGAPYSGATTTTLTVNPASGAMSGTRYRLTVYKCTGPLSANSAAATLTSSDVTAPTAVCRNITRNLTGTSASITPTDINNGSSDNCGTVNLVSVTPSSFSCANVGPNTVTLTINDGNGNANTCTGTVTIVDNTVPAATCRNITRPLIGSSVTITPAEINNGSTDNCGTVNLVSVSPSSFTCANIGTNSVTLTINDGNGNNRTCTGFVTVTDTTRPTITCPSNVSTSTNPTSCVATGVSLGSAGATDNCSGSPTISNNGLASYPVGVTNVTWTATDGSSNSRTCVQTVTVADLINPTAICQNRTVNLNASGTATVTSAQINNGSSDNCAIASTALSQTSFTCANIGTNPVTLTVTDNSGRTATCSATVTVADATAPTATCQSAFTVNLNASGTASILVSQINNGSTDNCSIATTTINKSTFNCTNLGANTITLTATDPSGNSGTCNTVVTIADVTAPVAVCQNRSVLLSGAGTATVTAAQINNNSTDNCGIATTTLSKTNFTCSDVGTNTVTLTLTDASGNSSTCTATVTVQETTPPSAVCRPSVDLYLNGSGTATPTFALIDNGSDDNCAITGTTFSPSTFDCSMTGTQTITMTVSDAAGNTASCTSSITVQDTTKPAAICRNVSLPLSAAGTATLTTAMVNNGSSDNCGIGALSITQTNFTCAHLGANTVTLSVDDLFGNNRTCNATVTVIDNLAPTAVCQNLNLHLNTAGTATLTTAMVNNGSSDNCGITALSLSQTSFTCANRGVNSVILTAVDASSNNGTCTATVTVIDSIRPTAVCQNASLVLNSGGTATLTPTMVNSGSSDNCAITTTTLSQTAFTCANLGSNTVTLTVADASGNNRTCTATVTVSDNLAPTAVCQPRTLALNASGTATLTPAMVNNGSTDNCGITGTTLSQTAFTCANIGTTTVTLTTTDASGNAGTCTATITVQDNTAPNALCQPRTLTLNASGTASLTPTMVNNGSTDNCSIASTTLSQTIFTCANAGTNTVTLTVTDPSGNAGTCTATITVVDNTAPNAVCQNASLALNASGTATLTPTMVNNGSTDNCAIASTTLSQTAFTCANIGSNTVTLTATDASGNAGTCTATITVSDNIAPNAICQPRTLTLGAGGTATLTPTMVNNGSTDNCAIASTTLSQTAFTCANIGTTTVTLTATDGSGNAGTCTSVITVQDNTAPNAVCQPVTLTLNAGGTASLTPTQVNNGSSDNCSIASTTLSQTSFTCANAGSNSVTLTVTDPSGNAGTCTATITVLENTAPNAVCQNASLSLNASGTATLTPTMVNNGSTDNCAIASTTLSQTAFTCANIGTNIVTLTVTDASGNAGTCTATITVSDNLAPNAICQPSTLTLGAGGTATLTPTMVNNGSTDNCAIASTTLSQTAFTCANIGTTTVTLTATDGSGNAGTCTSVITVQDNTAPSAVCQPVTLTLNASGTASLTPTQVNNGSSDNCSIASTTLSQTSFTCANTGPNSVTLTVTDGSGNAGTCVATVTVIDNSAPNAVCQNVSVTLDAAGNANITPTMVNSGSTDNCAIASYTLSQTAFTCAQVGTNTVTMTTVDASGNTSSCTATVTVLDNSAPNAVCGSVNAALDSTGIYTLDFAAIDGGSSDNCAIDSILLSQTVFTCADTGQNTVLVTLMDPSGNTSTCVATVVLPLNPVVVSLNAPLFNCGFHISCAGDSTGSIQPSVSGGCSPYTYAWSNGSSGSSLSGLPAGTYTVSVTDAIGRTEIQSFTLTEPTALSATISGSSYACLGDPSASLNLSALGGNSCQSYSYLWSDGDTTEDRSGLLAGTYSVTVTDASGCSTTQTATINTAPLPDPGVTASVLKCIEDSITLSATAGFVSYNWSNGQTNASTTVLQAGTYTVQVTDSLGCVGADTVNVVNRPSPSNFVNVQGSTIICIGDTTALVGDPGYASYTWSTGATTASLLVSGAGGNFVLTVTDQFGCAGSDTATVTFHNVNVPNPVITPNPTAHMCQGGSVDLDAGGGYAVYTWSNSASTQIVSISAPGVYNVTVANGFGCTKASDSVTVIQVPNPTPTITFVNDTLNVTGSYVAFQWLLNSVPIPGAILPYYVPTIDGSYSVQVTDINGCQGVSAPLSVVVTGLRDELASAYGLGIYPNPTRDHLFLQASRVLNGTLDLHITDLNGRLLYATQRSGLNGSTRIDLPAIASGMYLLQVQHAQKGSATFKFVVE